MREPGSGTRLAIEAYFRDHGQIPRAGLEVGDNSGVKEAVAAGLGVAILSRHAIDMELALRRLVLLDVRGFPLHRQWYIIRAPGKRLSRAAEAFQDFLLTSADAVVGRAGSRGPEALPGGGGGSGRSATAPERSRPQADGKGGRRPPRAKRPDS